MKAIIIKTTWGEQGSAPTGQSNAPKIALRQGWANRATAKEFVLILDNVCGLALHGDIIRVYKAGKTLFIEFESEGDAAWAMEEIKQAMVRYSTIATIETRAINVSDE